MKYFIGAASMVIIILIGSFVFIYSGLYNMSATSHHNKLTLWMINTLRDKSMEYHANDPSINPPDLSDTSLIKIGYVHYRKMCVGCHGAPGRDQGEIAQKGFYPHPPLLVKTAKEFTPKQLFWIIKNGYKMTAMPAFGTTHSDDEIWALVSIVQKLPSISKEQFQLMEIQTKGMTVE
ncbi:MAG: cytochrome c [Ignavibacteriaceae bacterium]|nr:cytochrome c [Ignavibacteriaceae bacterium]